MEIIIHNLKKKNQKTPLTSVINSWVSPLSSTHGLGERPLEIQKIRYLLHLFVWFTLCHLSNQSLEIWLIYSERCSRNSWNLGEKRHKTTSLVILKLYFCIEIFKYSKSSSCYTCYMKLSSLDLSYLQIYVSLW